MPPPFLFVVQRPWFDFGSYLDSDPTDELLMIIGIFTHFFALETTLAERQFFRALAKLIGRRAARLSSCGIAAIVKKMGYLEEGCSVGADGSLYNVCEPLSFLCSFSFPDKDTDCLPFDRNILVLQTGYMKVFRISLETRAGESMYFISSPSDLELASFLTYLRLLNWGIVTS